MQRLTDVCRVVRLLWFSGKGDLSHMSDAAGAMTGTV